jgi:hypothetical protein
MSSRVIFSAAKCLQIMMATPFSDVQNFHAAEQSFVDFKTETAIKTKMNELKKRILKFKRC